MEIAHVIIDSILALLTLLALVWTIISTRKSLSIAQDALGVSDETRKDDSLPILERYTGGDMQWERHFTVGLRNIGKGKLFNFSVTYVEKPNDTEFVSFQTKVIDGIVVYQVSVEEVKDKTADYKLTYEYDDRFHRHFKAIHEFKLIAGTVDPSYDVGIPQEIK